MTHLPFVPHTATSELAASAEQLEEAFLAAAHRWGERSKTRQNGLAQVALCENDYETAQLAVMNLDIENNKAIGETFIAKARVMEAGLRISACQKLGRGLAAQYADLLEKARQACCDWKDRAQILLAAKNLRNCKRAIEANDALDAAARADWEVLAQQEEQAKQKAAALAEQLAAARKQLEWEERILAAHKDAVLKPENLEKFQEAAVQALLNLLD